MIYFVEGAPGIGKSYHARFLYNQLKSNHNRKVVYYKEEYINPVDLLRQAVLDKDTYTGFLSKLRMICNDSEYRKICEQLKNQTTYLDDYIIIAFMHITCESDAVKKHLNSLYYYEVDEGNVSYDVYSKFLKSRISSFLENKDKNTDYIFEGAIFHNPMYTLLGRYEISDERLTSLYCDICKLLCREEYEVRYIKAKVIEEVVHQTIINRKSSNGYPWEKGFERWFLSTSAFKDFTGEDGIVKFAKIMVYKQQFLLDKVPFNKKIMER